MIAASRSASRLIPLLLGSAAFVLPHGAVAQSAAAPAAPAADGGGLEEVIVTARKRQENVQNVPVAITAISGAQMQRYDLASLENIAAMTPQLVVVRGSSGSGADLSLRGIGSNFTSIGIEQSVAVNIDGVYYGQGRIINEGFFDMKQVEILKGPQALFFGKNATAGVISFTSADPGDAFEAMGRVGYETTADQTIAEGLVSGPINDKIGLRFAIRGSDMAGGYVQNLAPSTTYTTLDVSHGFAPTVHSDPSPQRDVPQEGDLTGRLTARFTPTDDLTVTLKGAADRYRVTNATWNNIMFYCPFGTAQVNPGQYCNRNWTQQNNNVPTDVAATNSILNKHGGSLYQDYDSYSFTGNVNYNLEDVNLSWVSGYHHFENYFLGDYDDTGTPSGVWGAERSEYHAFSTELRAQTTFDGQLNGMGGFYYQSTKLDFHQLVLFPGGLSDLSLANPANRYVTLEKLSRTDGETFAGFAQAIWKFLPDFELTAGLRYTHETKNSFFVQPYVVGPYSTAGGGPFVEGQYLRADQGFNNLVPEATVTWKPDSNLTVYAAYKEGFKSGGFSGSALYSANTTVSDLAFGPERVRGYEIGAKTTWLNGRLRVDGNLFTYRYTGLQVDFFDASKIQYQTFNAGSATTQGAEIDVEWAPKEIEGLVLHGDANYDLAQYGSFDDAPCYDGQTPGQGCNLVRFTNPTSNLLGVRPCAVGTEVCNAQNLSGAPTALAPRWTISLQADYDVPFGNALVAGFSGAVHYSGSYKLNAIDIPVDTQPGYATLDATVRVGADDDRWQVALIGKNLTSTYVLYGGYDASGSGGKTGTPAGFHGDQIGFPGNPRTIELQATLRY
jgi:outer membrane receptor protein involved in Fe transport